MNIGCPVLARGPDENSFGLYRFDEFKGDREAILTDADREETELRVALIDELFFPRALDANSPNETKCYALCYDKDGILTTVYYPALVAVSVGKKTTKQSKDEWKVSFPDDPDEPDRIITLAKEATFPLSDLTTFNVPTVITLEPVSVAAVEKQRNKLKHREEKAQKKEKKAEKRQRKKEENLSAPEDSTNFPPPVVKRPNISLPSPPWSLPPLLPYFSGDVQLQTMPSRDAGSTVGYQGLRLGLMSFLSSRVEQEQRYVVYPYASLG